MNLVSIIILRIEKADMSKIIMKNYFLYHNNGQLYHHIRLKLKKKKNEGRKKETPLINMFTTGNTTIKLKHKQNKITITKLCFNPQYFNLLN